MEPGVRPSGSLAAATVGTEHLRTSSVSPLATLFQSISFMAPGGAIVFSLGIAVPLTGNALPISVLIAGLACLFAAVALGQLASAIPSAGGLYAYATAGIGRRAGFMVGWFYVGAALTFPAAIVILFGWYIQTTLEGEHVFAGTWWLWALLCIVIVFLLTYFDVRLSTRASMVLGTIEIIIFLALSLTMVLSERNSLSAFNPASAPSTSGLFTGAIFGILAFTGFEVASTFGEEAKNPRQTVKYAIVLSALIIGLFLVFATYAGDVGAHFDLIKQYDAAGGNLWNEFGHRFWGTGWLLVFFALLNSIVANAIAAVNTGARLIFAMARVGAAPRFLTRVHPRHRTPSAGIASLLLFATILAVAAGAKFGSLAAFGVLATAFTIFVICAYMVCCAACISYFRRSEGGRQFNWLLHGVIPLVGILAFVLPLYSQYFDVSALFHGDLFHLAVTYPLNWADWGAAAWVGAGLVLVSVLAARNSPALAHVHALDAASDEEAASTGEPLSVQSREP